MSDQTRFTVTISVDLKKYRICDHNIHDYQPYFGG